MSEFDRSTDHLHDESLTDLDPLQRETREIAAEVRESFYDTAFSIDGVHDYSFTVAHKGSPLSLVFSVEPPREDRGHTVKVYAKTSPDAVWTGEECLATFNTTSQESKMPLADSIAAFAKRFIRR
jgi:hypothetical protein